MPVFRGSGTAFKRGDGASPEIFVTIADVISISGPGITKDEIETTALDSNAKEFIGALDDPGEITLELNQNFQDPGQPLLRADAEGSALGNFEVVWSDVSGTKAAFNGEVMEYSITAEANDAVKASVRIKVNGSITWTP